jgi:hypothetical protein
MAAWCCVRSRRLAQAACVWRGLLCVLELVAVLIWNCLLVQLGWPVSASARRQRCLCRAHLCVPVLCKALR